MNDVAASIGLANYPYVRDLVAKHKENLASTTTNCEAFPE